ncbi:unnamed protein product [Gulo gulo]|uniref:Uncharacterized protein n=1 Tax=Gulo gulo TaxID=48420 RepID=A0A9X9M6H1_GULGU|nr:unnamed protein product [Gulo gulo]
MGKVLGTHREKNLPGEGQSSFRKNVPLEHSLEGVSTRRKNLTRIVLQTNTLLKQGRKQQSTKSKHSGSSPVFAIL